jgi:hypothetical protein
MKTHTQWRQHVEAWRESGLSQAEYCRQHGLNLKIFPDYVEPSAKRPVQNTWQSIDMQGERR